MTNSFDYTLNLIRNKPDFSKFKCKICSKEVTREFDEEKTYTVAEHISQEIICDKCSQCPQCKTKMIPFNDRDTSERVLVCTCCGFDRVIGYWC